MPQSTLSELQDVILHTIWRLRGIGNRGVKEETIKEDIANQIPLNEWTDEIKALQDLGFVNSESQEQSMSLSLTPLGLAILRQLDQDKLEELK